MVRYYKIKTWRFARVLFDSEGHVVYYCAIHPELTSVLNRIGYGSSYLIVPRQELVECIRKGKARSLTLRNG